MKKFTNILIWALLLFLITPSSMALASWNAVPGDATYPWKLSLEKFLLMFMSPSSKLQSTTQVKITERRFSELEQTLNGEYAFESLDNLEKQLETTTSNIQKINKQETQNQVKEQYIASLKKMSASLDEQKSQVVVSKAPAVTQKNTNTKKPSSNNSTGQTTNNNQNNNNTNNNSNTTNPTSAPSSVPTTPTPTITPPSNEELIEEIEETQEKIEEAIVKVEAASTTTNTNNNKQNNDDEEEEEKKPKWVKPEPTVNNMKTGGGTLSVPKSEKDNDTLAPAAGQRSGSANWQDNKIDML